jgi:hypothetical protein
VFAGHATAPCRAHAVCWALLALAGCGLALAGCGQPPSFELTWRIGDESWRVGDEFEDAPELAAVKQCSDVGIFAVRVTVSSGDAVVWVDEYPCFSTVVEGPTLEPGEYTIEVQGLRRNGSPWAFDPAVDLAVDRIAYASTSVIISDGGLANIEVGMRPPLGCDDGIDNDVDGVVDMQDPGCEIDNIQAPSEFNDVDVTLFDLGVTFLGSPIVKPANVNVQSFRLEVDGELLAQVTAGQLDYTKWAFQLPLLAGEFEGGEHVLSVTAVGQDGVLTEAQTRPFTTVDGQGTYVNEEFDFGAEQFLEPVVEPLEFGFLPKCAAGGLLALETMRIRILDENGDPLPLEPGGLQLSATELMSVPIVFEPQLPPEEGWVTFDCPSSHVTSNPLLWGRYHIEAQARLASVVCFETPAVELAPQPVSAQTITLERVMNNGVPACPECVNDVDCLPVADKMCDEGLCVDKEPGQ